MNMAETCERGLKMPLISLEPGFVNCRAIEPTHKFMSCTCSRECMGYLPPCLEGAGGGGEEEGRCPDCCLLIG